MKRSFAIMMVLASATCVGANVGTGWAAESLPGKSAEAAVEELERDSVSPDEEGATAEELREWLLNHLTMDLKFSSRRVARVEQQLANMDLPRLRAAVAVYQSRQKQAQEVAAARERLAVLQQVIEQTQNLVRAQALRDQLQRDVERQALMQQTMSANNQAMQMFAAAQAAALMPRAVVVPQPMFARPVYPIYLGYSVDPPYGISFGIQGTGLGIQYSGRLR